MARRSFEETWGRVASDPTNAPAILREAGWPGIVFLEHAMAVHGGIALPWSLLKAIIEGGCHHA